MKDQVLGIRTCCLYCGIPNCHEKCSRMPDIRCIWECEGCGKFQGNKERTQEIMMKIM